MRLPDCVDVPASVLRVAMVLSGVIVSISTRSEVPEEVTVRA
jgi:hypothetical protein